MITKLEDGTVVGIGLPLDGKVRTITKEEWNEEWQTIMDNSSMCPDFHYADALIDASFGIIEELLKECK